MPGASSNIGNIGSSHLGMLNKKAPDQAEDSEDRERNPHHRRRFVRSSVGVIVIAVRVAGSTRVIVRVVIVGAVSMRIVTVVRGRVRFGSPRYSPKKHRKKARKT